MERFFALSNPTTNAGTIFLAIWTQLWKRIKNMKLGTRKLLKNAFNVHYSNQFWCTFHFFCDVCEWIAKHLCVVIAVIIVIRPQTWTESLLMKINWIKTIHNKKSKCTTYNTKMMGSNRANSEFFSKIYNLVNSWAAKNTFMTLVKRVIQRQFFHITKSKRNQWFLDMKYIRVQWKK